MEKPSTIYSNSSESFLPGICKELIGSSIDFLGQSFDEEKTTADSLLDNLLKLYNGLFAISKAHEEQDEESQDNRKPFPCFSPPRWALLCPTLFIWDKYLMHLVGISQPCLDALMAATCESFHLETVSCSNFPSSSSVLF